MLGIDGGVSRIVPGGADGALPRGGVASSRGGVASPRGGVASARRAALMRDLIVVAALVLLSCCPGPAATGEYSFLCLHHFKFGLLRLRQPRPGSDPRDEPWKTLMKRKNKFCRGYRRCKMLFFSRKTFQSCFSRGPQLDHFGQILD